MPKIEPLSILSKTAQTGLLSDMTTSRAGSESSVVNTGTYLMDGDEKSAFDGCSTSRMVHNVSGLMNPSAQIQTPHKLFQPRLQLSSAKL